jgi:hypothetical protein
MTIKQAALATSALEPPQTTTSAPAEVIPFDEAVAEGKAIVAHIEGTKERGHFRLGELAAKVETKYGDRTQAKLAKAWSISASCLKRYVSVYRAWEGKNIGAPGPQSVSYAVLRELATHPEREQIIRDNPNLTKREAQERMRELKDRHAKSATSKQSSGQQQKEPQGSFHTDLRRYLTLICVGQEEICRKAEEGLHSTDEQLDALAQIAGELTLSNLRADAKMVVELADLLLARRKDQEAAEQTEQTTTEPEEADAPQVLDEASAEVVEA